ncbi:hypothetical protein SORDD21_01512 [Streptococcus oralis]|uniref:Uncharacterized protein n=1 Tax=Streptococcus oralis TaxID=1303 RepID=A0A139PIV7_STROR|nr:hypothetical protein SORDD21_01512 [Streptococcus oralis]
MVIPFLKRDSKRVISVQIGDIVIEIKQMYLQNVKKAFLPLKIALASAFFAKKGYDSYIMKK